MLTRGRLLASEERTYVWVAPAKENRAILSRPTCVAFVRNGTIHDDHQLRRYALATPDTASTALVLPDDELDERLRIAEIFPVKHAKEPLGLCRLVHDGTGHHRCVACAPTAQGRADAQPRRQPFGLS
ncbi:uncharacterized protein SPSK_02012 [Sporothrix schenckii 1099-18]|uniref:Uncharacterized protein n=1 Tax=Sporothrix schenckii 1099-18 TaxID=1397361 RepID=A0A0F2MGG8_SPOSC|nr:uncharacterized protein SPSK_02012 [Sporothrix schenckii 1099-18]KJR87261.1 hypothetical protein SPSK_02012 [Sporothrix schenckii 1099-18]